MPVFVSSNSIEFLIKSEGKIFKVNQIKSQVSSGKVQDKKDRRKIFKINQINIKVSRIFK